jgi:hypothetical protein
MADPKIKIKRSAVAGKIPTTNDLELGELAINTHDGKVFIEQDQGGVGVGTTVIVVNPWSVGVGSDAYDTYFTAGSVGIGTISPAVGVTSSNNAVLAVGVVTAYQLYGDGSNLTGIIKVYNQSTAPSDAKVGDRWVDNSDGTTYVYYDDGDSKQWVEFGAVARNSSFDSLKSITIDNPGSSEKIPIFFTPSALTFRKIQSVIGIAAVGSGVTFSIRYGNDITQDGTEIISGGVSIANTTTGISTSSFDNPNVPENNFVWITTSAISGAPTFLHTTLIF